MRYLFCFLFSGAGNIGVNALTDGETSFIQSLQRQSQATVIPIYPYELGNSDPSIKQQGLQAIINGVARVLVDATLGNAAPVPATKAQEIYNRFNNPGDLNPDINLNNFKITFIGYSGGSQVSYNIAQDLRGKLFVDNLVAIGPTYKAYAQL